MAPAARVAVVTGGAGAIGAAICRALAAAGQRVAVADLSLEAAAAVAKDIDGIGVALDVTDPTAVEAGVARARETLGPVGVAVSCAGWDEMRPFVETDEAFQARVLDVNLAGPMRLARAVLPDMAAARWGRIVNIASDAGRVGSSGESIYSGAKGGLVAFTKTIAREHARQGITANAVCPGPTDTPLFRGMAETSGAGEKITRGLERAIPMKRLARPEDIAPAVAFLASEAAGYITGQTLSVSGGLTMA